MAPIAGAAAPAAAGGGGGGGGAAAQVVAANETAESYFSEFGASNPTAVGIIGSMTRILAQGATAQVASPTRDMCAGLFKYQAAESILAITAPPAGAAITPDDEIRALIQSNMVSAGSWLFNLIAASKKTPISPPNVEGFFASIDHVCTCAASVAKFINQVGCAFPDEVHSEEVRNLLMLGTWTDYRLTRCATGAIIKKNISVFIELGIVVDGDAVHRAIEAAASSPWDIALANEIPSVIKAYACIYLEAAGTPIEKWRQGNKARDDLPSFRARGAKEIFRRYLEIKNSTNGLNAVNDLQTLTAPGGIAANFF